MKKRNKRRAVQQSQERLTQAASERLASVIRGYLSHPVQNGLKGPCPIPGPEVVRILRAGRVDRSALYDFISSLYLRRHLEGLKESLRRLSTKGMNELLQEWPSLAGLASSIQLELRAELPRSVVSMPRQVVVSRKKSASKTPNTSKGFVRVNNSENATSSGSDQKPRRSRPARNPMFNEERFETWRDG